MDEYILEITIPGLPKTPNQRQHWAKKMKEIKYWRETTKYYCMAKRLPPNPLSKARLTLIRGSSKPIDIDNGIASFKPIIDGLRDAKVISDDNPNVVKEIQFQWAYATPRSGYVKIKVESIL